MSALITSDGSHVVHRGEVVVAVVPVYNPSLRLHDVVTRLACQCAYVVVVDDGSEEESWTFVSGMSSDQVRIVRLSHNSGIAAALNEGVRYSLTEWDVDFILTCDQDSLLSDLYVAAALHRLRQAGGQEGYAL